MTVTIAQALDQAVTLQAISDSWRLDAELLLAKAIGKQREYLYSWPEAGLDAGQLNEYQELLSRRRQGEPVAYLTGTRAFWDFELSVNPSVLIPRPETELLVERALRLGGSGDEERVVADLGTGSGAIAIALGKTRPSWRLSAVDVCEQALAVARSNAAALAVDNIEFVLGSWCEKLDAGGIDIIVANPPYVEAGDGHLYQGSLPFEPQRALVAGEAGLGDIRSIVQQSRGCLKAGGWLLLEHGFDQQAAVEGLLQEAGFSKVTGERDLAGIQRMVSAQWTGGAASSKGTPTQEGITKLQECDGPETSADMQGVTGSEACAGIQRRIDIEEAVHER